MRIGDDRQDGAAADRWAAPQGVDGASPPRRVGSFGDGQRPGSCPPRPDSLAAGGPLSSCLLTPLTIHADLGAMLCGMLYGIGIDWQVPRT